VIKFLDHVDIFHLSNLLYEYRHEQKYKSQFKKRFIYLVLKVILLFSPLFIMFLIKGFNEQQQYSFWDIFVKFKELKQQHPTAFTQNFVRSCRYLKDILKDVDRTLPEYDKYSTEEG